MRVKVDPVADAAYLYFVETIAPGSVAETSICDVPRLNTAINVDFDSQGRVLGVELLGVSGLFREATLTDETFIAVAFDNLNDSAYVELKVSEKSSRVVRECACEVPTQMTAVDPVLDRDGYLVGIELRGIALLMPAPDAR